MRLFIGEPVVKKNRIYSLFGVGVFGVAVYHGVSTYC
jgi:hypothetical protein